MKNLLAVALSAFLLLSNGDAFSASAPTKVVIAYAAMNARIVPLWAAEEKGFFNKYSVDGQLVFVRGAPTLNAAMVSGDIQMGYTGGTAVLGAAVGGADLKILAVFTNRVTYDLVTRPNIKSLEDLRGKQVGVTSIGGTNWMGTILGLERLGLDPNRDKINFIVAGDDSVRTQALLAGALDATAVDSVYSRILREKGLSVLAEFSKLNIPISSAGIAARNAFIQKNPRTVENALKAIFEGAIFGLAISNKTAVMNIIKRHLKINEQEAEEGYKDMMAGIERKPYPSLDGLRNIQRLMKTRNPKVADSKVEDLIDSSFVRRLDQSGFFDQLYSVYGIQ